MLNPAIFINIYMYKHTNKSWFLSNSFLQNGPIARLRWKDKVKFWSGSNVFRFVCDAHSWGIAPLFAVPFSGFVHAVENLEKCLDFFYFKYIE